MDTIFDAFEYGMAGLGMLCGWFFGGFDGFYGALVAFTAMDYVTGLFAAAIRKELSSEVGFQGIARKVTIFILVGVANVLDTQLLGQGAALRLAVIFFYLANEGLSIMENAAEIGLPVPAKLKEMLTQIHRRSRDASAASPPAADALKETVRESMDAARDAAKKAAERPLLVLGETMERPKR